MRVTIVGAGSAGLMTAALLSAEHEVTVLEKKDRPAKKLLATGNGRANLTNTVLSPENYHGGTALATPMIERYGADAVRETFRRLGLETTALPDGRVFPQSMEAKSVLDTFYRVFRARGVTLRYKEEVRALVPGKPWRVTTRKNTYEADAVVFAPGGATMRASGSDGTAYALVQTLGHHTTGLLPGITKLSTTEDVSEAAGVRLTTGTLYLRNPYRSHAGDILFTEDGISGQAMYYLSSEILRRKSAFYVRALPQDYTKHDFYEHLARLRTYTVYDALIGLLPEKLIPVFARRWEDRTVDSLTAREGDELYTALTEKAFFVKEMPPMETAQVTQGGIDTNEVTKTLESKLHPGLYFAGEVLDVDGDCGGYNLHWAWACAMTIAAALGKERQ